MLREVERNVSLAVSDDETPCVFLGDNRALLARGKGRSSAHVMLLTSGYGSTACENEFDTNESHTNKSQVRLITRDALNGRITYHA